MARPIFHDGPETLRRGGVVYELHAVGEYEENDHRPGRETRTAAELLTDPPPPSPMLLEPSFIVEGGETVLAAPTKVGKTNFWLHVAWALTDGATLWRHFTAPSPVRVLLLELELSEAIVHRRLDALREALGWSDAGLARLAVRCERALTLNRQAGQKAIARIIEETPGGPPDVVILDSFNAAVRGDPDKTGDAREALHSLHEIQEATGITWCLTNEMRKAPAGSSSRFTVDDVKGNNEILYDCDTALVLRPTGTDRARRRLALDFVAVRHDDSGVPEDLVLVREGLSFSVAEGASRDEQDEQVRAAVRGTLEQHLAEGGERNWRACIAAVRSSGVSARNELIGEVRRELLEVGLHQQLPGIEGAEEGPS